MFIHIHCFVVIFSIESQCTTSLTEQFYLFLINCIKHLKSRLPVVMLIILNVTLQGFEIHEIPKA
jgi:hypothetical protein